MTFAQIQTRLDAYLKAEADILAYGSSNAMGDNTLTRADLREIRIQISNLDQQLTALQSGGRLRHSQVRFGG